MIQLNGIFIIEHNHALIDTYTLDELVQVSKWCLTHPTTIKALTTWLRDRAMHLLCTASAYRGENVREVGLSDLFIRDVQNVSAGYESKIMVSLLVSFLLIFPS
jgi:hypothetical protein